MSRARLRDDLRTAGLLLRTVCARLRALAASRLLGDTDDPLKRIVSLVGYRSIAAFVKGLRVQLDTMAGEIRSRGGIWAVRDLLPSASIP